MKWICPWGVNQTVGQARLELRKSNSIQNNDCNEEPAMKWKWESSTTQQSNQIAEIVRWILWRSPPVKLFDEIHATKKWINTSHWSNEKRVFKNELSDCKRNNAENHLKNLGECFRESQSKKELDNHLECIEIDQSAKHCTIVCLRLLSLEQGADKLLGWIVCQKSVLFRFSFVNLKIASFKFQICSD